MSGSVLKTFLIITIALLIPSFLGAEQNSDSIVLGMSAAFKGPTGGLGIELYRGAMAYFEHVNRNGGIYGKKIVIKAYDDGYNPIPTIKNTIKLVEEDNVFTLFNYVGTPTVTRILPILKSYSNRNIYLFFPFTGALPHRKPPYDEYVFNLRASYEQETGGLVENFIKIGRKKIGIFYQADAYGRSGWDGVRKTLAKYGSKIVAEATYKRGAKYSDSFKKQVEILKNAGADAVISVGAYAACAGFIRDARDMGWDVPIANVSFVGSEFMINLLLEEEKKTGRKYTYNLINSQVVPSYEDMSLRAVKEYRDLMDRYNPLPPSELMEPDYRPLKYSFVSFEGFLNAKVIVEVLKKLGKEPKRENIKKVVEHIKNLDIGIDEKISFSPTKHQALNKVYYTTYKDGKFVPIKDWSEWKK
ncbi:ABC-type branched-chain amino acid transport system, substrate-binding protein [Thermodesulfovibrio aggregans]|uniref:ABC-type branched-chain amino acid transport system, substrate-binding protein n=1 Tax=Thermodesulfovibrio aggregans TaxID=86166 RepID=A0A0U9IA62_9BACT|nr:ABC transporter substrate-binding protein [Thermodesulfovibrio aggregans]GAQ95030.1 ABC-type branched-chain amino acid transport system, substrate-binding protein [Thermodesulfovibrio aggregans]